MMAHPHLAETRAQFAARVHRTKNRLVAIPAMVQRQLGLGRRPENFLALISLRRAAAGRWNHHYVKLTFDNEFAIPSDVAGIRPGDEVEVKIHRIIRDQAVEPASAAAAPRGAALLLALAREPRPGWRADGAENVDRYLQDQARGS
jgi:hypothetical protein